MSPPAVFEQNVDPAINTPGLPTQWTEFGNQIYFDRPADKAYQFRQDTTKLRLHSLLA